MLKAKDRHFLIALLPILLPLLLFACTQSPLRERSPVGQAFAASKTSEKPVSDVGLRNRLRKELMTLYESGKTATSQTLLSRIGRPSCRLDLARPASKPLSPGEIYRLRKKSVVVLGILYKCKKCTEIHSTAASGFVISKDGAVVTNYHVVKREDGFVALGVMTADGKVYPVTEILAADARNDLAILKVEAGEDITPLPLVREDTPVGEPVALISHPSGHFYTLSTGIVSRHIVERGRKRLEITADYAKGSSGAPILDAAGNATAVVRTTTSIYYTEDKGLQMVVKTCVPASALKKMIK